MREAKEHWREIWETREPDEVSWYEPAPTVSLRLIQAVDPSLDDRVIDVGGGASRLVDRLVDQGFENVAVLDIAPNCLKKAKRRLGSASRDVQWIVDDVLEADLEPGFDLWHDRALFHFFTEAEDRIRYVDRLRALLAPGGHAILATFSPQGPETCSGRSVQRYDARALGDELGEAFTLVADRRVDHTTPWGTEQSFQYAAFQHLP